MRKCFSTLRAAQTWVLGASGGGFPRHKSLGRLRTQQPCIFAPETGLDSNIHLLVPSSWTSLHHRNPTSNLRLNWHCNREQMWSLWRGRLLECADEEYDGSPYRPLTFLVVQKSNASISTQPTNTDLSSAFRVIRSGIRPNTVMSGRGAPVVERVDKNAGYRARSYL